MSGICNVCFNFLLKQYAGRSYQYQLNSSFSFYFDCMQHPSNICRCHRSASFTQTLPVSSFENPRKPLDSRFTHSKILTEGSTFQADQNSVTKQSRLHVCSPRVQYPQCTQYSQGPTAQLKRAGDKLLQLRPLLDKAPDQRNVREALETLRNYQLNVVVDLKDVIGGEDRTEDRNRVDSRGSGYRASHHQSREQIKLMTNKRKELQGSFRDIKAKMDKKQLDRSFGRTSSGNFETLLSRIRSKDQLRQSDHQIQLKQQLRTARQTITKLKLVNEDLHLKVIQTRKACQYYAQESENQKITIKELDRQVTVLRQQIQKLEDINSQLEKDRAEQDILQVLENGSGSLDRDFSNQYIFKLENRIKELETRIMRESQAKARLYDDLMDHRESLKLVQQENSMLRRRAFNERPIEVEKLQEDKQNFRNAIPRLVITEPDSILDSTQPTP